MKRHLNFDGNQNNGIISNAAYDGAFFVGAELKPVLTFEYHSFMYSEEFDHPNYVIQVDGIKRLMTAEEEAEIVAVADAWQQAIGQEGNPSPEQQAIIDKAAVLTEYEASIKTLVGDTPITEISSWPKQEAQARAYLLDDTDPLNPITDDAVSTVLLDRLVVSRGLDESKLDLARKIISNAEAYEAAYADVLGVLQSKLKALA